MSNKSINMFNQHVNMFSKHLFKWSATHVTPQWNTNDAATQAKFVPYAAANMSRIVTAHLWSSDMPKSHRNSDPLAAQSGNVDLRKCGIAQGHVTTSKVCKIVGVIWVKSPRHSPNRPDSPLAMSDKVDLMLLMTRGKVCFTLFQNIGTKRSFVLDQVTKLQTKRDLMNSWARIMGK